MDYLAYKENFRREVLAKPEYAGFDPRPHTLYEEKVIKNNVSSYEYNFDNNRTPSAVEKKIDTNDVFLATGIMMALCKEVATNPGQAKREFFPNTGSGNTFVDTTVGANTFTATHMEVLYNAILSLKMGQLEVVNNLTTRQFHRNPAQFVSGEGMFVPLTPKWVMVGGKTKSMILAIPSFTGIQVESVTVGTDHKVGFYLDGYILTGAAKQLEQAQGYFK